MSVYCKKRDVLQKCKYGYVYCNEFVGLVFTFWLWVEGSEIFRWSRNFVLYASGIKLQ